MSKIQKQLESLIATAQIMTPRSFKILELVSEIAEKESVNLNEIIPNAEFQKLKKTALFSKLIGYFNKMENEENKDILGNLQHKAYEIFHYRSFTKEQEQLLYVHKKRMYFLIAQASAKYFLQKKQEYKKANIQLSDIWENLALSELCDENIPNFLEDPAFKEVGLTHELIEKTLLKSSFYEFDLAMGGLLAYKGTKHGIDEDTIQFFKENYLDRLLQNTAFTLKEWKKNSSLKPNDIEEVYGYFAN